MYLRCPSENAELTIRYLGLRGNVEAGDENWTVIGVDGTRCQGAGRDC